MPGRWYGGASVACVAAQAGAAETDEDGVGAGVVGAADVHVVVGADDAVDVVCVADVGHNVGAAETGDAGVVAAASAGAAAADVATVAAGMIVGAAAAAGPSSDAA